MRRCKRQTCESSLRGVQHIQIWPQTAIACAGFCGEAQGHGTHATHEHRQIHVLREAVGMAPLGRFVDQCCRYRSSSVVNAGGAHRVIQSLCVRSCDLALALQHADHCPCEAVEVVTREGGHDQCKAVCSIKEAVIRQSMGLACCRWRPLLTASRMHRAQVRTKERHFPPGQHGEAELHLVPAVLTRKRSQHG